MFQATRRRLALWYTTVTAVLLLLFATGFYWYVRTTLVERLDDTLSHVVEVVQRSLVLESSPPNPTATPSYAPVKTWAVNVAASFQNDPATVEADHIDLEWFSPTGELLWSTLSVPLDVPIHVNPQGETVHVSADQVLRQVTERIQMGRQVVGYLRVSHPWFEVTKPVQQLVQDLSLGVGFTICAVAGIGWLLSGLAMEPVRESYQQLRQFTADASHELRNPIAVIQTNAQVALSDPDPDPEFQTYQLRVIERLTRRLSRLVDDLLFLARQDSGLNPPQFEWVEMDALLIEVLEEQQAIAVDQHITLSLHLDDEPEPPSRAPQSSLKRPVSPATLAAADPPPYRLRGDRDQLIRLVTNLVSNAIQYTPRSGTVEVWAQWVGSAGMPQFELQVRDTGQGIPAEAIPRLFDRFYRVDPARSHPEPDEPSPATAKSASAGSGLGLAIAQAIVTNHHGSIRVDSTLGIGSTLTVRLPVDHPHTG